MTWDIFTGNPHCSHNCLNAAESIFDAKTIIHADPYAPKTTWVRETEKEAGAMGRRQSARFRMPRITNRVTENRSCSTTGAAGSRDYHVLPMPPLPTHWAGHNLPSCGEVPILGG